MTTPSQIRDALVAMAAAELGGEVDTDMFTGDTELAAALDSMQLLSLVVQVEDHFKVILEEHEEATVVTVDDLVGLVAQKLAEAP